MKFAEALKEMKRGIPMKLPSWGGYWCWDAEKETIIIYTKDNERLDIRETQRVEYTLSNVLSDEWIPADGENCSILGGTPTFGFGEAVKYLKRGFKVTRKGWNGKGMWLCLAGGVVDAPQSDFKLENIVDGFLPWIGIKTVNNFFVPWLASQTDILAEDWMFVE